MPELPEVETIRRDLAPLVDGRRITGFAVLPGGDRLLQGAPPGYFRQRLTGRRIGPLGRRGKYLLLPLSDEAGPDGTLIVHLRMTGSLRHRPAAAPADPFLRARLTLDDGTELRFTDVRKFGTFEIVDDVDARFDGKLGPEPLSAAFTVSALWEALRGRHTPVKAALLDQTNVAGLGNIYVDEALFLARLHPEVPAGSLRPPERRRLHAAVRDVLRDGIDHRGASFRDYTDGRGDEGTQQFFVRVFRRTGEPCDVCGTDIRRSVVGGRSSHWCPRCQPRRQRTRLVPPLPKAARRGRRRALAPVRPPG